MATFFVNKERVDIAVERGARSRRCCGSCATDLNLTGTKYGCGMALCGACTVYVDGQPVRSCQTPLSALKPGAEHHDDRRTDADARRPGRAGRVAEARRAAVRLLPVRPDHVARRRCSRRTSARPTPTSTQAMAGNICRCAHLRAHPRGHQGCARRPSGKEPTMNPIASYRKRPSMSRRDVPQGGRAAGAGLSLGIFCADALAQMSGPGKTAGGASRPAHSSPMPSCASARTTRSPSSSSTSRWARDVTPACRRWSPRSSTPTWSQVRVEGAPADAKRYNNLFVGRGAGHRRLAPRSRTRSSSMRQAGAAARAMLVAAAAGALEGRPRRDHGEERRRVSTRPRQEGDVRRARRRGRRSSRCPQDGQAQGREGLRLHRQARAAHRLAAPSPTAPRRFTQDVKLPDMLTAVVAHPPRFGAKVKSFDAAEREGDAAACATSVEIPNGVAVLAADFWTAKKGPRRAQGRMGRRHRRSSCRRRTSWPSTSSSPATPGARPRARKATPRRRSTAPRRRSRRRTSFRTSRTRRWSR